MTNFRQEDVQSIRYWTIDLRKSIRVRGHGKRELVFDLPAGEGGGYGHNVGPSDDDPFQDYRRKKHWSDDDDEYQRRKKPWEDEDEDRWQRPPHRDERDEDDWRDRRKHHDYDDDDDAEDRGINVESTRDKDPDRVEREDWIKLRTTDDDLTKAMGVESCGLVKRAKQRAIVGRVIDGTEVEDREIPWAAFIAKKEDKLPFCGAAIISNRWLLTAAHCMFIPGGSREDPAIPYKPKALMVGAAASEQKNATFYDVLDIIVHPRFSDDTYENDIALVLTSRPIDFLLEKDDSRYYANAFCLPGEDSRVEGDFTIAGWGTTAEGYETSSPKLLKTQVETVDLRKCREIYEDHYKDEAKYEFPRTSFCAKGEDPNQFSGPCSGDNGGPLFKSFKMDDNDSTRRAILVGIVSVGISCSDPKYPSLFTRVPDFVNWIHDKVDMYREKERALGRSGPDSGGGDESTTTAKTTDTGAGLKNNYRTGAGKSRKGLRRLRRTTSRPTLAVIRYRKGRRLYWLHKYADIYN